MLDFIVIKLLKKTFGKERAMLLYCIVSAKILDTPRVTRAGKLRLSSQNEIQEINT